MANYRGPSKLTIPNLILPGTHNSGYDKEAKFTPSSETCQDRSPITQLKTGIRVLDIRTQFYSGYSLGDPRRFQIFHASNSGRNIEEDILGTSLEQGQGSGVNGFHYSPQTVDARKEIVILDFHQFKNFTDDAHQELAGVIKNKLNDYRVNSNIVSSIIEPELRSLTLSQIWARGDYKNTVIAYNAIPRDVSFWPGVNQRWIGKNDPSESELKSFMDSVGNETKSTHELRSIQCARYVWPFFVPKDMSDSIRQWFYSENKNSYI